MLELLFPRRCVLCGSGRDGLCERCAASLQPPPDRPLPHGLERLVALCTYEGAGRELVLALKRGNRRAAVPLIGAALGTAVRHRTGGSDAGPPPTAGVTWAPTTAERARRRGFDQAELLARALAKHLGIRPTRALERHGGEQMGLTASERSVNPVFAPTGCIQGAWLVVDDVVTTGATITGAARALTAAGAERVVGVAVAVAADRRVR